MKLNQAVKMYLRKCNDVALITVKSFQRWQIFTRPGRVEGREIRDCRLRFMSSEMQTEMSKLLIIGVIYIYIYIHIHTHTHTHTHTKCC